METPIADTVQGPSGASQNLFDTHLSEGPVAQTSPLQSGGPDVSMTPGDRILANMTSFQPQSIAPQQFSPIPEISIPDQSPFVDPMQALDWQMQTVSIRGELGLTSSTSDNAEQGVESLLKAQG